MFIPIHFLEIKALTNVIMDAAPLPLISAETRSGGFSWGYDRWLRQTKGENDAMPIIRSIIISGCFAIIAGCTGKEIREGIYMGVYEGARIEKQKEMTPRERAAEPEMDYQQYTKEQKERVDEIR
jgi:hypothetical protein